MLVILEYSFHLYCLKCGHINGKGTHKKGRMTINTFKRDVYLDGFF